MSLPDFVPIEVAQFYEESIGGWKESHGPWAAATRLVEDERMKKVYSSLAKVIKLEADWRQLFALAAWASIIDFDDVRTDCGAMREKIKALTPLLADLAARLDDIESSGGASQAPYELTSLSGLMRSYENPIHNTYVKPKLRELFSKFNNAGYWPAPSELVRIMADAAAEFSPIVDQDLAPGVASQKPSDFASYVRYVTAQIKTLNALGHPNGFSSPLKIADARLFDIASAAMGDLFSPKLFKNNANPAPYTTDSQKSAFVLSILKIGQ